MQERSVPFDPAHVHVWRLFESRKELGIKGRDKNRDVWELLCFPNCKSEPGKQK